jgi:hypothetical protein
MERKGAVGGLLSNQRPPRCQSPPSCCHTQTQKLTADDGGEDSARIVLRFDPHWRSRARVRAVRKQKNGLGRSESRTAKRGDDKQEEVEEEAKTNAAVVPQKAHRAPKFHPPDVFQR